MPEGIPIFSFWRTNKGSAGMLKGFFLSGMVRGYVIFVGLALQFVMAQAMTKEDFGAVNTFISTVILATFLLTAAPTRQLVRELGAFGLKLRGNLAQRYLNASHLFLALSAGFAGFAALIGQTWFAAFFLVMGVVNASALYSAYFRGIGRYIAGNLEAGVIRITVFLLSLLIFYWIGGKLSSAQAQMLYVLAAVLGLILLVWMHGGMPRLNFRLQALWPYGRLPIATTILAGIEIFTVNYDLMVVNAIYGSEVAAEVRIGQQLRSLSSLPLQIYLMFSLDKLSRALRANDGLEQRRREMRLVRLMLGGCFALAILVSGPFTGLFFDEPIEPILIYSILAGILPLVLLGPRPDLSIAAATEGNHYNKTIVFVVCYLCIAPGVLSLSGLAPEFYFMFQATLVGFYFISLHSQM
ncbi:hypothetical protein QTA57_14315 [Fontisubflavum oceani]|uniref:hypothetical protein n=1 Tax=Fontisubflavum oceani TaxID=2978973 RepID=UPI0025B41C02|nr:hypothetical protein [Fontisubflavum oceani]WJY20968.1 hypothetical protein QTA57_14315 [Fontisubflavum oceani]